MNAPPVLMVLTDVGEAALAAAKMPGGAPVRLVAAAIGSAERATVGDEVALTAPILSGPIAAHSLDEEGGRIDLGLMFSGVDVEADHEVREVGVFDEADRLIFYWSTDAGALGAITPLSDYALAISVHLATAPLSVIEIIDAGAPVELILLPRIVALERRARDAAWRNLYLAQA